MSAIVLEAVRQPYVEGSDRPREADRPRLVLLPTGRDAVRVARDSRPALHLTGFGRLVVSALVAGLIAVLAVGLAGQLASASGESRTVTVQSGQTLSAIAARELPDLSVGEAIVELQVANRLSTAAVHAGQRLVVPAR
jgi:hypothetical protein